MIKPYNFMNIMIKQGIKQTQKDLLFTRGNLNIENVYKGKTSHP